MTRDAERSHQRCLASGAASVLVFPNLQLDVVGAGTTSLMLAALLVQLVRLIVAAPQADEAFEAHLDVLSYSCRVVVNVCGSNQTAHHHVVVAQTNLVDLLFCNQILCDFSATVGVAAIGPVTQARRRPHRSERWKRSKACSYSGEEYAVQRVVC